MDANGRRLGPAMTEQAVEEPAPINGVDAEPAIGHVCLDATAARHVGVDRLDVALYQHDVGLAADLDLMDEAFAIPTEEAMKIALRTQQIIAHESGVASVVDPLGGSYFVESLTTQYERAIFAVVDEVDRSGGTMKLTQEGWFQRRIADFAYDTALKKANGEKPVIGVNKYAEPDEQFDIELHPYDASTAERQIARLNRIRRERDQKKIDQLLDQLVAVAKDDKENIMPSVTAGAVRRIGWRGATPCRPRALRYPPSDEQRSIRAVRGRTRALPTRALAAARVPRNGRLAA